MCSSCLVRIRRFTAVSGNYEFRERMSLTLASIVINNRNYARFLGAAIDSALAQTYEALEVVVVDDGSTDDSRRVMEGYGDAIRSVYIAHAGQAAAFNAGVAAANGEVLFFLDSDDLCARERVERIMGVISEVEAGAETAALVFHPQRFCDRSGKETGKRFPPRLVRIDAYRRGIREESFRAGELSVISTPTEAVRFLQDKHYLPFLTAATSGLALTRLLAERLFPLPTTGITICADSFISLGALLEGSVILYNEELSRFRMHGKNRYMRRRKRPHADRFFNERDAYLNRLAAHHGIAEGILRLDNWERVRRYLRNKPLRELLVLLMRSEAHQYAWMLLRKAMVQGLCCLRGFRGTRCRVINSAQKSAHQPIEKEAEMTVR